MDIVSKADTGKQASFHFENEAQNDFISPIIQKSESKDQGKNRAVVNDFLAKPAHDIVGKEFEGMLARKENQNEENNDEDVMNFLGYKNSNPKISE